MDHTRLVRYCKTDFIRADNEPQYHQSVVDNAKQSEKDYPGRPLAVALDTVGKRHL